MDLGRVLEVGRRILRRHWAVLLMTSLAFVGPGALLSAATFAGLSEEFLQLFPQLEDGTIDTELRLTQAQVERLIDALLPFLGATLLAGVLSSIGALAFSKVVAEDYHSRQPDAATAVRAALERTPSALAFMLVTGLLVVGIGVSGLLAMSAAASILPAGGGGVGGPGTFVALIVVVGVTVALVYLTMRWAPAYAAMVEEGAGWRQAFRRSWHLSGENVLRIFALSAIVALLTGLVSSVLAGVFDLLLAAVAGSLPGLDPIVTTTIATAASAVIVGPAMAVFTAVLYFDLRARRDAAASSAAAAPPRPPYR